jgi:hypothetical protein
MAYKKIEKKYFPEKIKDKTINNINSTLSKDVNLNSIKKNKINKNKIFKNNK